MWIYNDWRQGRIITHETGHTDFVVLKGESHRGEDRYKKGRHINDLCF